MSSDDRSRGILAVDPGSRRYGVAFADLETRFARPVEVIDVTKADPVARVAALVRELGAIEVVVGRPIGLSGSSGPAVAEHASFVARLEEAIDLPVVEHDERLTTVIADQGLRASGSRARSRREVRDAVAAQVLLQSFLDARQ